MEVGNLVALYVPKPKNIVQHELHTWLITFMLQFISYDCRFAGRADGVVVGII